MSVSHTCVYEKIAHVTGGEDHRSFNSKIKRIITALKSFYQSSEDDVYFRSFFPWIPSQNFDAQIPNIPTN